MNWKKIITELEAAGLTQTEIASLIECSQPYVSQLKTGVRKKPDFDTGNALVALHKTHCPVRQRAKEARAA